MCFTFHGMNRGYLNLHVIFFVYVSMFKILSALVPVCNGIKECISNHSHLIFIK